MCSGRCEMPASRSCSRPEPAALPPPRPTERPPGPRSLTTRTPESSVVMLCSTLTTRAWWRSPRPSVAIARVARAPGPAVAVAPRTRSALAPFATVRGRAAALARGTPAAGAPAAAAGADARELLDGLAGDVRVVGEAQADAAALAIDLDHAHVDLVALVEHVLDALDALARRDVGDVQQPVGALRELHERAEGRRLDDLPEVLVADLDLLHHHLDALDERVAELAVGGVDQHLAVVVDVDLGLELLREAADRFAALADQQGTPIAKHAESYWVQVFPFECIDQRVGDIAKAK